MAKSTPSNRSRRPHHQAEPDEQPIRQQQNKPQPQQQELAATAVAEPQQSAGDAAGGTKAASEDVASFDAETNAKYEQVKGGKLYIKDLQTMDIHGLHEIAKQEGIQDYIGLKKQDLIFQ